MNNNMAFDKNAAKNWSKNGHHSFTSEGLSKLMTFEDLWS